MLPELPVIGSIQRAAGDEAIQNGGGRGPGLGEPFRWTTPQVGDHQPDEDIMGGDDECGKTPRGATMRQRYLFRHVRESRSASGQDVRVLVTDSASQDPYATPYDALGQHHNNFGTTQTSYHQFAMDDCAMYMLERASSWPVLPTAPMKPCFKARFEGLFQDTMA